MEALYSGWLIKSPGTKYVTIFSKGKMQLHIPVKTKWRRRFFVLYKPKGSLPNQYGFDYYKDERLTQKRGSIDLDNCTEILASLDSSFYSNLFSVRTSNKSHERVYYLGADTEQEMTKWVSSLCRLCGLRSGRDGDENDNNVVAPNPPERIDSMNSDLSDSLLADEELSNQILREIEAERQNGSVPQPRPSSYLPSYTELADCTTGESVLQVDLSASVPTSSPPPPPNGISEEVYDQPRRASPEAVYNSPRSASLTMDDEDVYDTPRKQSVNKGVLPKSLPQPAPKRHSRNFLEPDGAEHNASSSSINSKLSHAFSKDSQSSLNDISPDNSRLEIEDVYDVPRKATSCKEAKVPPTAPPRPPKPAAELTFSFDPDTYENVTDTGSVPANGVVRGQEDNIYDIPKSLSTLASPPPCSGSVNKVHKYVNASTKVINQDGAVIEPPTAPVEALRLDDYVLDRPVLPSRSTESELPGYLPMGSRYTPMSRVIGKDQDDTYQIPPVLSSSSKPSSLSNACGMDGAPVKPSRPFKPTRLTTSDSTDEMGEDQRASQSFHTRSYIRDDVFSDTIKLPERVRNSDSSSTESSVSDCDEGDDKLYQVPPARPQPLKRRNPPQTASVAADSPVRRTSSLSKVEHSAAAPSLPVNSSTLGKTPAPRAPPIRLIRDIQYVELDQSDSGTEHSPQLVKSTSSNNAGASKELEYIHIDMVKTQALSVTRKERDMNIRKRSEILD